ncbi:hypothetical protein [Dyadobacter sediminis]|uniref:Uncharacterized protein n=1 Tax=Dyadobacter sediminis TaxID=1493691 RepID=A0A5R9KES5_9BACT|nr:hypothetical protein [Dyadobacter sediminis]TLU94603.1 hypothetical protein FEM55_10250 [Dyadobacter sediminis]
MKLLHKCLILLMSCLSAASCTTTAILSSKFENYTAETLPAHNIPGDPSGDEITYVTELQPRIRIVNSVGAGQKALRFNQVSAPGLTAHNQWLGFKGISTNLTQPLWFYFTATHSGTGGRLTIDVSDGVANLFARMMINSNGDVIVVRSFPSNEELVGNIPPGMSHTIIFTLNLNNGKYNLSILKSGGNILVKDIPVLAENILSYANPSRPAIGFRFEDGSSDTRQYVLEEIFISKKQP